MTVLMREQIERIALRLERLSSGSHEQDFIGRSQQEPLNFNFVWEMKKIPYFLSE